MRKNVEEISDKVVPVRTYIAVWIAVMVLALATIWAATLELGPFHTVVALGIAIAKAVLIILYFMHMRYSTGMTRLVFVAGLLWLGILLVGTMDDFVTRGWLPVPGK